jgi:hypothetical protein
MMAARRQSVVRIFAFPMIIALIVAFGLVSVLLGDGIWDAMSWIALASPLAVGAFFLWKRQG